MKKNLSSVVLEKVGAIAINTLKLSANSTSSTISHQPKMPKSINQFKKKSE
ncbi:AgrD family cyclic lactone autoinducer peptide [Metaclostridioides mangenotii]|uniref:Cyclic lactone autoinducer peptide n=1 Tax=Metaclostridioides mangenotii TaxID=1540 RepID=A0ABS4EB10_9FIRM|nr:cyclic lactone autoinducer peptide [Clostridioides mangenotii]MBP1855120.1 cyclic lactone autoinducer peptide [Clostridioides mangenotii]